VNEPTIELTGHLGADPTLRFTPNGVPVTDLRIATTRRFKIGEEWQDGETMWFEVAVWKQLAEHVAASVNKGDKVMVKGRLTQRSWTRDDGTITTKLVIDATGVGVDLGRAPVKVLLPVRESSAAGSFPERWGFEGGDIPPLELPAVEEQQAA
jgi:single-strand DNA-binding protein